MKIRSDYVSNSSSSSYIVVLGKGYKLNEFIKNVVKSCSSERDFDYTKQAVKEIDRSNRLNLEYYLNNYTLLFLGELKNGKATATIDGIKDCESFMRCLEVDRQNGVDDGTVITSNEPGKITYECPVILSDIVVSKDMLEHRIRNFYFGHVMSVDENERRKIIVKDIVECAEALNDDRWGESIGIYEITLDTIQNTEDLIAEGYEVELDGWCKDLAALRKRIEVDGERIFHIQMRQGGDGQTNSSVFALNGWDSDINKFANVQVLRCYGE